MCAYLCAGAANGPPSAGLLAPVLCAWMKACTRGRLERFLRGGIKAEGLQQEVKLQAIWRRCGGAGLLTRGSVHVCVYSRYVCV